MSEIDLNDNLDGLIDYGRQHGWAFIDQISDFAEKRVKEAARTAAKQAADHDTIVAAWKGFAATPGGRKALQDLCNRTINTETFLTHLGLSADQVAIAGAQREGQKRIVWQILKLIAEGEPEDRQPKSREAQS